MKKLSRRGLLLRYIPVEFPPLLVVKLFSLSSVGGIGIRRCSKDMGGLE